MGFAIKQINHLSITASGHLGPIFGLKILKIARYSCGFEPSDRAKLTQIRAPRRSTYLIANPWEMLCV